MELSGNLDYRIVGKLILAHTGDDFGFLELVNRVVSGLFKQRGPEEGYIIRIDNWFDHKWLNWRSRSADTTETRIPFFAPNRVLDVRYFLRDEEGVYTQADPPHDVHFGSFVHSRSRKMTSISNSAIFAWFSSNSRGTGRGSLMVYEVANEDVTMWFASFQKGDKWTLLRSKGIGSEAIRNLLRPD